jgi:hypothetical protein
MKRKSTIESVGSLCFKCLKMRAATRYCCAGLGRSFPKQNLDGFSINSYCAPRLGNPKAFVTGGGFHLPVRASGFGL